MESILLSLLGLIAAITVHEFSHAFVADKLGDPTPNRQGRLTLNPLSHIDLLGTIVLPIMMALSNIGLIFGWAKPVQFDPFNLKNPRRDAALISVAGPISNFLLAIILSILLRVTEAPYLIIFIQLNVMLGVFNLLPIHPLDGFKIVGGLLPEDKAREWYQLERYGILFLILLILPIGKGSMISSIISPAISFVMQLLLRT